ncbi:MAG: DMT family transporter [Epsilonproteobacteria bacterium]|nr:DMT family transporter [Campylobacterota bacterium]
MNDINRGVLFMLMASFFFAIMGGFAKALTTSLPAIEIVFFRNVFGFIAILYMIYKTPLVQSGGKPLLLLFRGMMGFFALLAYFYIFEFIPLGEAMTYNKLSSLFVAFFAFIFFKEKLSPMAIFALFLGFFGVILFAKPFGGVFDLYDILGIFSGICAALAYTSIRELQNYYETRSIVLSFMAVGTIMPIIFMLLAPYIDDNNMKIIFSQFVMPSNIDFVYILLMSLFATFSQFMMTKAYEISKAGIVSAVSYSGIFFSTVVGIVVFGDAIPDFITSVGIILIIVAGVMVTFEKQ